MAEYIEKEKVRAEFKKNFAYGQNENFAKWLERVACEIVDKIPVADVQPVRRGKWIEVSSKHSKCSCCETTCLIAQYPISANANFCPNCGARMDGDTE